VSYASAATSNDMARSLRRTQRHDTGRPAEEVFST